VNRKKDYYSSPQRKCGLCPQTQHHVHLDSPFDAVRCLSNKVTSSELHAAEPSPALPTAAKATLTLTLTTLLTALLTALLTTLLTALLATLLTALLATLLTALLATLLTVVTTTSTAVGDSEAHTVVLGTALSDRHQNRLMVGGGGHGADAVGTSRKTRSKIGREGSLTVTSVVDTLEECEFLCIRGVLRLGVTDVLDTDMSVTDNVATLQILRSDVVSNVRVRELSEISGQQES
jgi:hypothetical protein